MIIELDLSSEYRTHVKTYEPSVIEHNTVQLINHVREWSMINGFANHYHALDVMLGHQTGYRKDEKTPKYLHEILENIYAITVIEARTPVKNPELFSLVILFHDLVEDIPGYDEGKLMDELNERRQKYIRVPFSEMNEYVQFLETAAQSIKVISKKSTTETGEVIRHYQSDEDYYAAVFSDEYAGPAKLIDILQNISSSNGIHEPEYIAEKIEFFNNCIKPLISQAKNRFPHHAELYDILEQEIDICNQINSLKDKSVPSEILEVLEQDTPFEKLPFGIRPAHVTLERHTRNIAQEKKDYTEVFSKEAHQIRVRSLIL